MNIVKMQEMLKGVPENALVGYVQNPGQVPAYLALGEIQRRKKMREEAATQAQAPQQSVAEQMVAQAQPAPMDMGVASLPGAESVGNEEAYAQGGIVGYKLGGESATDSYWAEQERAADERGVYGAVVGDWLGEIADLPSALRRHLTGGHLGDKPPVAEAPLAAQEYLDRRRARDAELAGRAAANKGMTPEELAYINRRTLENAARQGVFDMPAAAPNAAAKPQPRPGDARTRTDNGATKSGTPAASPAPAGGVADLLKYDEIPFDESAYAPIKEIGAKGYMQEWRDLIGEDPGRAGLNKRMTKLESRAAETERQAPWQAFTKAGLAMASGSSPFWAQNVGKGAMVGVEDYSKSRDKLQELEEKRFDMAQRLAAADRAETIAAAKYGADSAQVDRAANEKRQLQKLTNSLDVRIANAKGKFEAQKGNLSAQIDREKMASEEKMAAARNAATLAGYKRYEGAADKALIQQRTSLLNNMLDEVRANLSKMRDGSLMATPEQVRAEEARYNQILSELAKVANVDISAPPAAPIDYTSAYGLTPRPKQK